MKNFFGHFNSARALILLCVLGAIPRGWFAWKQQEENDALRAALRKGGLVEQQVRDIQQNSRYYSDLIAQRDQEGLAGKADPDSYIRTVARKDSINLGQVRIEPSTKPRKKPIVDKIFRITPDDKDTTFGRVQLANFLFTLENDSQRVRVTEVKIESSLGRKVKPEEIPPDAWKFEARITSRQREDS